MFIFHRGKLDFFIINRNVRDDHFLKLKGYDNVPNLLKNLRKYLLFKVYINFSQPWGNLVIVRTLENQTIVLVFRKPHQIVLKINNKVLLSCHNNLLFVRVELKLCLCPVWEGQGFQLVKTYWSLWKYSRPAFIDWWRSSWTSWTQKGLGFAFLLLNTLSSLFKMF